MTEIEQRLISTILKHLPYDSSQRVRITVNGQNAFFSIGSHDFKFYEPQLKVYERTDNRYWVTSWKEIKKIIERENV